VGEFLSLKRKGLDFYEKIILFFLVFSIPMQYSFFKPLIPLARYVSSERYPYQPFFERKIYYTISDVLIFSLVIFFLFKSGKGLIRSLSCKSIKYLHVFFLIALLSIIFSSHYNYFVSYLRLMQLCLTSIVVYIILQRSKVFSLNKMVRLFCIATVASSVFQSFVALIQYFGQKRVGLKILGEINMFAPGNQAIISLQNGSLWLFDYLFNAGTHKILTRAFGTLPHPNILGGYLVMSILASIFLLLRSKRKSSSFILSCILLLQIFSLFITYSRSAFFGLLLSVAVYFSLELVSLKKRDHDVKSFEAKRLRFVFFLVAAFLMFSFILLFPQVWQRGGYVNYENTLASMADVDRKNFQSVSLKMLKAHPLFGVGFNNFCLEMKNYVTDSSVPINIVHNTFLLVLAETGILGFLSFNLFFFGTFFRGIRKSVNSEIIFLTAILVAFGFVGCCDNYFLTSTPGKLMLFSVIGMMGLAAFEKEMTSNPNRKKIAPKSLKELHPI
jgi:O-antigen ligase